MGVRAGSWLWVVDVFCSFVFWTHGAFTTRRWSAAYELDTHLLLLYVICSTAATHGGWVDRLVGVTAVLRTTGLWVGGSVRWCVHGFVGYFLFCFVLFSSRYTGPALA